VELARAMFKDIRSDFNMTGLEFRMSCLQVKALMTMLGKLRKVKKNGIATILKKGTPPT
jgi:hypothetical protein